MTGVSPEIAAAFALHATPGAYAVLLGSGVSRAAGVPTGYEVLVDLCRRHAVALGAQEEAAADPVAWYSAQTGTPATYDQILAGLTSRPEERVGLLRGYFEPTEEEREQGLKVPTAAHRGLAQLASAGLVTVILTTNFDRLVEHALDAQGVPYVVTATPTAVAGALPLHLQRCQVIKLHGDYLDPGLLNTTEELASYQPPVDRLLDRVFDEYGLIVVGWSATYDVALRTAIERSATRRFSTWWVDPGSLSDNAKRLVDLRGATVATETADAFFDKVAEATAALAEIDRPVPQTVTLASAMAKRAIAEGGDRIRLHDLIKEQLASVAASPQIARDNFQGGTLEGYGRDVEALEAESEILLAVVAIAAYWGDRQTDAWWIPAIADFAERVGRPPAGGSTPLINLTRYPGLLLFQTGAVAAAAANRWDLLARLDALQLDVSSSGRRGPAACTLDPGQVLGGFYNQNGRPTGLRANDSPVDHLRDVIRSALTRSLLLTVTDLDRAAETTEYLLAASSIYWNARASESDTESSTLHAPQRYGGYWLPRTGLWGQQYPRISQHARAIAATDDGPIQAGMFGGELEGFTLAASQFDASFHEFAQRMPWQQ